MDQRIQNENGLRCRLAIKAFERMGAQSGYFVGNFKNWLNYKSKKEDKDQETIQSSTTPNQGYQ